MTHQEREFSLSGIFTNTVSTKKKLTDIVQVRVFRFVQGAGSLRQGMGLAETNCWGEEGLGWEKPRLSGHTNHSTASPCVYIGHS